MQPRTTRFVWPALALSIALLTACDGSSAGGGDTEPRDGATVDTGATPTAEGLPCDVTEVLEAHCLGCHADEPLFAAPMPLTSHEALHAAAVTRPEMKVYELLGERIHDTERPMPPPTASTLDDSEKATLDAFVAAMAPARPSTETCGGDVDSGVPPATGGVGPEHLPCEPTHTLTAHAPGSADGFEVSPAADNDNVCFNFRSPFAAGSQATAWAPIIGDARVLHHWILYRTSTEREDGSVGPCNMPSDATFLMGWAPGGENAVMPPDVGLGLGEPDDYYILQLHYWNPSGHADAVDASGLAICTTETPRAQEAGVLWLGSANIDLPPRSRDVVVTNNCPPLLTNALTEPLQLLASGPHMHMNGTRFVTEIHRDGDPSRVETLVEVDPWDFNNQTSYPHVGMALNPGDAIVTRCTFDNPTDARVTFGERTEDEMCFNFLLAYPMSAIPGGERRACLVF